MAKMESSGQNRPEAEAANTSYSTRFDPKQRALIEQAAEILGCSPAKLIRESAVMRAAHVVNAGGPSGTALRELAWVVVRQLQNPTIRQTWLIDGDPENPTTLETSYQELVTSEGQRELDETVQEYVEHGFHHDKTLPGRPDKKELEQIRRALETSGTEFVRMLVEAWGTGGRGKAEYRPQVDVDEFLNDGAKD